MHRWKSSTAKWKPDDDPPACDAACVHLWITGRAPIPGATCDNTALRTIHNPYYYN